MTVLRPWDELADAAERGRYYGFERRTGHPVRDVRATNPSGGVVYFDQDRSEEIEPLLRTIGVYMRRRDYCVLAAATSIRYGS